MPCTYYTAEEMRRLESSNYAERAKEFRASMRKLNSTVRILCDLCHALDMSPEKAEELLEDPKRAEALKKWWKAHQAADAKRRRAAEVRAKRNAERRKERARKKKLKEKALSKLSKEERKALGL